MNKSDYIQLTMIRNAPAVDKMDACIDYAEIAWSALTNRGYGSRAKAASKSPRKTSAFIPPSLSDILEYAKKRGREDIGKKFFDYFTAGDWFDAKGNRVKNWKQKFITWEGCNHGGAQQKPEQQSRGYNLL